MTWFDEVVSALKFWLKGLAILTGAYVSIRLFGRLVGVEYKRRTLS